MIITSAAHKITNKGKHSATHPQVMDTIAFSQLISVSKNSPIPLAHNFHSHTMPTFLFLKKEEKAFQHIKTDILSRA